MPCSAAEVTFYLVPQRHFAAGADATALEHALPNGTILFFKRGAFTPAVVGQAREPKKLPEGEWTWIAQADGYVSAAAGSITSTGVEEAFSKKILWPVVPACHFTLAPSAGWDGVDRLDIVSLDHQAVYPVEPRRPALEWVPAGRYLTYSVGAHGLLAVSAITACRAGEEVAFAPPEPPAAFEQDLVAHLDVEPGEDGRPRFEPGGLVPYLAQARPRPTAFVEPSAMVLTPTRFSLFFLGVSTESDWELVVSHPRAQTVVEPYESLGGSVREVVETLLSRKSLSMDIDYRPRRKHQVAKLVGEWCGRVSGLVPLQGCTPLDQEVTLHPGIERYTLENLDWGQYRLWAEVDGFKLEGLGRGLGDYYNPFIEYGERDNDPEAPFKLWEMSIYGQILLEGEPVAGTVVVASGPLGTSLRAPTDDELFYHLDYFASEPSVYDLTAEEREQHRDYRRLPMGLPNGYGVSVCSDDGVCRYFSPYSRVRGEGRLDFDLGAANGLSFEVVDGSDGEPIAGASVLVQGASEVLVFEDGEVTRSKPLGAEGRVVRTDVAGRARLRGLDAGRSSVLVRADGYESWRQEATVAPEGVAELRVELDREGHGGAGIGLRLRYSDDGLPVSGAFLLPVGKDGDRKLPCIATSDRDGEVRFRPGCPGDGKVIVLHSAARITAVDGSAFGQVSELAIERAPHRPLQLRVVTGDGTPVVGAPIELRFNGYRLASRDTVLGSRTGAMLFYLTDVRGELWLRGVDPGAPDVPVLAVAGETRSLAGYQLGETVEIVAH